MTGEPIKLAESTDPSSLGVLHLKRFWEKSLLKRSGKLEQGALKKEWKIDTTLLAVLGLGLEQTLRYQFKSPGGFQEFEQWILIVNKAGLNRDKIEEFNKYILNRNTNRQKPDSRNNILTEEDLDFWNAHGYVIIRNAVSKEDCENAIKAICDFMDIKRDGPSTWYRPHPSKQGIMVQLFQDPALEKSRQSPSIRAAYEQLWQRTDLWVNTDRAGFNPPETERWKFPGPRLHWDVSLQFPIPFGLQGILYLSDTAVNQGAFTLVPGFQHKIETWIKSLPPNVNPRNEDIYALGAIPIAANAGDFIIWHHALPHGSSPNTSSLPRFVQYINLDPLDAEVSENWI
jgi:ectoine hydroxylase-related dioxygenase (phytanoyl-CoA dioxygenase family)